MNSNPDPCGRYSSNTSVTDFGTFFLLCVKLSSECMSSEPPNSARSNTHIEVDGRTPSVSIQESIGFL